MNATSSVGKLCPKCRHKRTATETVPDWQCPNCGIAYAKFEQAQAAASTTLAGPVTAGRPLSKASAHALGATGTAMFAHLSILIGGIIPLFGIIVPIVLWIVKSGKDDLVVANAKEAINFQISVLLWALLLVGLAFGGVVAAKPLLWTAVFLAGVLAIAGVVLPIIAAVKANGGEAYRYPFTAHIFG
jgi:uncharacterized protein